MLKGRLGLETARIPHADRFGLVYLERGALGVEDGCLRFVAATGRRWTGATTRLPHQSVSFVLLGPGSTVSHDALRLWRIRVPGSPPSARMVSGAIPRLR